MKIKPHRELFEDALTRSKYGFLPASLVALLVGCSGPLADAPNIVVPLPGETEENVPKPEKSKPSPAREEPPSPPQDALSGAPDPEAVPSRSWFEITARYRKGEVTILGVRRLSLESPRTPDRKMGRFAVELFAGKELVERVRFEFPLLADERDGFEAGLTAEAKVLIPDRPEARGARLFDRKTGTIVSLSEQLWPSAVAAP